MRAGVAGSRNPTFQNDIRSKEPSVIQVNRLSVGVSARDNVAGVPDAPLLSRFANDPEMRELVALFVTEAPDRLREIRASWEASDLRRLRMLAHQIKGAAGGYGYPEVSAAAAALEAAANDARATKQGVQPALDTFTALLSRVVIAG